jgi:RNA polymerase sigma-70 factor, ECF subfamily
MASVTGCLDREDVARLYAEHGAVLVGYACSLLADRMQAEDVVHHIFVRLLRGDIAVRERSLAYLCQAVRNGAMNHWRKHAREVALDESGARWLEAPRGREEAALAIERALAELPEDQREVIVLKVWGQLSFQDIGDILETSSNTAASRYRYGLAKLRNILKPLGDE